MNFASDSDLAVRADDFDFIGQQGAPHHDDQPLPLLVDVHSTANMLGLSDRTIWRLVELGKLPQPVHLGRSTRWRTCDLIAFVEGLKT